MPFYQFQKVQFIKASVDDIWEFISSPQNLKQITPSNMGFDIRTTNLPNKIYTGMIISYTVRPLWGISTNWVTEITHIRDENYFVDVQRVGPYKLWHHLHIMIPENNGVLTKDIVSYQPPLGLLGKLANTLIIRNKLKEIFDYRTKELEKLFTS